jgi:hypothetical protein
MEPISAIATSLALGAGAVAGKELVAATIKDAYAKLKALVNHRYPKVSLDQLEQTSGGERATIERELTDAGAAHDAELVETARRLAELIEKQAPSVAEALGIDSKNVQEALGIVLKNVQAANFRAADIAASHTAVLMENSTFSQDIEIQGVRGGLVRRSPGDNKRKSKNLKKN